MNEIQKISGEVTVSDHFFIIIFLRVWNKEP